MSEDLLDVYQVLDVSDYAYLLKSGKVYLSIEGEDYPISGNNLIVGATEIVLGFGNMIPQFRFCGMKKDPDTEIKPISKVSLRGLIQKYNIGYNVNTFLAKSLLITNALFNELKAIVNRDENKNKANAIQYHEFVTELEGGIEKSSFPDLLELIKNSKEEIIYESGKIYSQQKTASFKVNEDSKANTILSAGSEICTIHEKGNEMYIINQGIISVIVNDVEVAEISDPGSVIGEIALFLGEKRTATLRAKTDLSLAIIKRENLETFVQNHPEFFETVSKSLSGKIRDNIKLITHMKSEKKKLDKDPVSILKKEPGLDKLTEFSKNTLALWSKKKYPQMEGFVGKHMTELKKYSLG